MIKIALPLDRCKRMPLKAGENVLLSGRLYTARDMAHKKLVEMIKRRQRLPIFLKDEVIYYCGPTPPPPGRVIGSCGPTTSSRMDSFTIPLLEKGLGGIIGKGGRSKEVRDAIREFKAVYFITTGGAGALLARSVKKMSVAAFRDLGTESIYELEVKDFPVIVAVDAGGKDIYESR